jgi:hypothetical protein
MAVILERLCLHHEPLIVAMTVIALTGGSKGGDHDYTDLF